MPKVVTPTAVRRMAYHGAMKMPMQGYTYEPGNTLGVFFILKPVAPGDDANEFVRDFYVVTDATGDSPRCSCPFFKEYGAYGPCKHTLWLSWMLEAEEVRWEREIVRKITREGGGLGIPQLSESRLMKMFAHPSDKTEARLP